MRRSPGRKLSEVSRRGEGLVPRGGLGVASERILRLFSGMCQRVPDLQEV